MIKLEPGELLVSPNVLPTPSVSLNHALGGGVWTDRITTAWGNPGSGKTTFFLHLMAQAQKQGYIPLVVDTEKTYTEEWAKACGIDIHSKGLIQTPLVEEISAWLLPKLRKEGQKYTVMVDSISGLMFENALSNDDGGKQIGMHAVPQKWLTNKLLSVLTPDSAVFYVAQQSIGMNQMGGFLKPNFGNAVDHNSCNIVKLFTSTSKENIERDRDTKRILSQRVAWQLTKTKQNGATGTAGEYYFNKETARIEKEHEIVHIAKRIGIIEGVTWLTYKGQKFQGMAKLMDSLTPEDYQVLEDTIMSQSELGSVDVDE